MRSSEPIVAHLAKTNFPELVTFVTLCTKTYLDYCFENQSGIAAMFAHDLIETRPSWKAADFINLFKFFRQRQDIEALRVLGNKITPQKLMEMVAVYEETRAEELEKYQHEKKIAAKQDFNPVLTKLAENASGRDKGHKENAISELLGKSAAAAANKNEEKRMRSIHVRKTETPDENWFKKNNML